MDTGGCAVAASVDKTFEQCAATDPYKTCAAIMWPEAWPYADAQTRIALVKSDVQVANACDCLCKTACAQFPEFHAYAGVKEGLCAEAKKVVDSIVPTPSDEKDADAEESDEKDADAEESVGCAKTVYMSVGAVAAMVGFAVLVHFNL
jgi:hypothetical protein